MPSLRLRRSLAVLSACAVVSVSYLGGRVFAYDGEQCNPSGGCPQDCQNEVIGDIEFSTEVIAALSSTGCGPSEPYYACVPGSGICGTYKIFSGADCLNYPPDYSYNWPGGLCKTKQLTNV